MFQIHIRKYKSYFLTHHKIEEGCLATWSIQYFPWAAHNIYSAVAESFPISLTMRTTITWNHLPDYHTPVKEVGLRKTASKKLKNAEWLCCMRSGKGLLHMVVSESPPSSISSTGRNNKNFLQFSEKIGLGVQKFGWGRYFWALTFSTPSFTWLTHLPSFAGLFR